MNRLLLISLSAFLFPLTAHAQCAMPNGQPVEAGVIVFNTDHKVMQYCNGDKWIGLWGGKGGGADLPDCSDSEIMQWSGGAWACNNGSGIDNLNAANLKSGTVPPARLGSGTADDTTFLRGDGTWATPSSGGGSPCSPANVQTFNANGTWTKPDCGTLVKAECWGGGGGGGRMPNNTYSLSGSGGAGGGWSVFHTGVQALPQTVAVTVGTGGAGCNTSSCNGAAGGSSSFGSYVIAFGGAGGNSTAYAYGGMRPLGGLGMERGGNGGNQAFEGEILLLFDTIYSGAGGGYGPSVAGMTSTVGGNGGNGNRNSPAGNGEAPGGGGGGVINAQSGAGGNGRCIVTTY